MSSQVVSFTSEVVVPTSDRRTSFNDLHRRANKTTRSIRVTIANKSLTNIGLEDQLQDVVIEEVDDGAAIAEINFHSTRKSLFNDISFKERTDIEIFTGFLGTDLVKRGNFVLTNVRFAAPRGKRNMVRITALGEVIKLGGSEKRREFRNVKDSDIARRIADENDLGIDVDETLIRYESVIQANESDIKFLQKRAKLHGFQVFVEDKILHFHALRASPESEFVVILEEGEESTVASYALNVMTERRGLKVEKTQFDPITGDLISVASSNVPDAATEFEKNLLSGSESIRDVSDITSEPTAFLLNEGHIQTARESGEQVESISQSTRFVMRLDCTIKGEPRMKAGRIIRIKGFGRFNGRWYLKRVTHSLRAKYTTSFTALRTLSGDFNTNIPFSQLDSSSSGSRTPRRGADEDITADIPRESAVNVDTGVLE